MFCTEINRNSKVLFAYQQSEFPEAMNSVLLCSTALNKGKEKYNTINLSN